MQQIGDMPAKKTPVPSYASASPYMPPTPKWDRSELANYDDLREKFAFHMADVAANFSALAEAYATPAACDTKCLPERTESFFYDCMPYLTAAAQIYDEIRQLLEEQQGVHDWSSFVDDEVAT